MIYTVNNSNNLKYNTPLIEFIKINNNYNYENLIYSNKYTNGTFSITNPSKEFINCNIVNGYPHFNIPLEICLSEIDFFLDEKNMYNYDIYIRYGDTHPNKEIPKLGQLRNLILNESLSSMIGIRAKSLYTIGDISIKTLADFIEKNQINMTAEELFIKVVNNSLDTENMEKLLRYDRNAIENISLYLKKINISQPNNYIIESSLYKNQELYTKMKIEEKYKEELKDNGELKYTLQELMFINYVLKNDEDILLNIIGSDQSDHICKVKKILSTEDFGKNTRFLSYGICKNATETDINMWVPKLNSFIEKNNIRINGHLITPDELLKIIFIINNNDLIIDFNNLEKYLMNIKMFCGIYKEESIYKDNININNDLISKMGLIGYTLNRSIEAGNQTHLYKYLLDTINLHNSNPAKYVNIENLYNMFIHKCMDRLGFSINDEFRERKLIK